MLGEICGNKCVRVRGSPPTFAVIVTQLVTQSPPWLLLLQRDGLTLNVSPDRDLLFRNTLGVSWSGWDKLSARVNRGS
jgi:hypothetical protein